MIKISAVNSLYLKTGLCLLFFFVVFYAFPQNTISGRVTSETGELLNGVNITITNSNNKILGYAITNSKGDFNIKLSTDVSGSLLINVRRLNYAFKSQKIENKTQFISFALSEEGTVLKEVIVEGRRAVSQRGDTISYNVKSFAEQKDRSIGDVLSKLPGIDVLSDGRVLYQGRPIEKYYIEGMDLLEGKYNLANNNLPHVSVTSVEVLENHQPIRILDSLVSSERASLNIRLKEETTTTGIATLGVGCSPLLWETNITPMIFKRNLQAILSYQANNTGYDAARELKTLTLQDLIEQLENTTQKADLLNIISPKVPAISGKRFLDNNVHMVTTNLLSKLRNQTELRLNVSYLNDQQKQYGDNVTKYFLPQGNISIEENINNKIFINDLHTNFTVQKNLKRTYLKNSFKAQINWEGQEGKIVHNGEWVEQQLKNPYYSFSNQLKWATPVGKQLFTIYSFSSFNRTPQNLTVYPGQFKEVLNNNNSYGNVQQQINKDLLQTNNYIEHTKKIKQLTFGSKLGFSLIGQQVESDILKDGIYLEDNFQNQQSYNRFRMYFNPNIIYKHKKWDVNFQFPLSHQNIKIRDSNLRREQNNQGWVISPRLNIRYDVDAYWRSSVSIGYNNDFQNTEFIMFGYVMNNYRTLQITDYPVAQNRNFTLNAGLNYRNPIKSLFFSSFYLFSRTVNPFVFQYIVQDDATRLLSIVEQQNVSYNHNLNSKTSKYFNHIKTTLSLGLDMYLQQGNQLVNGRILKFNNRNLRPNFNANTRFTENFTVDYAFETNLGNNKTETLRDQAIFTLSENVKLSIYPRKNQYIGLSLEHYYNDFLRDHKHHLYSDILYRYTFLKKKIDVELKAMNLFNENRYMTSSFTDLYLYQSVFRIRPKQLLLSVRFSF